MKIPFKPSMHMIIYHGGLQPPTKSKNNSFLLHFIKQVHYEYEAINGDFHNI